MYKPSKRLKKIRESFIVRGGARQSVDIDYLPDDHWVKAVYWNLYIKNLEESIRIWTKIYRELV